MNKQKYKKWAIGLAVLWLISAVVIMLAYFGISFYVAQSQGLHRLNLLGAYAVYPLWGQVLYLLPLLFFVQRFFYKAEMKSLGLIARIFLIYQAVCTAILVAYCLLMC